MVIILNDSRVTNRSIGLPLVVNTGVPAVPAEILACLDGDLVRRLIALLMFNAIPQSSGDNAAKLPNLLFQVILDCAVTSRVCWTALADATEIPTIIERLILRDPRPLIRSQARDMVLVKFSRRNR
jgi:hypothetical protein